MWYIAEMSHTYPANIITDIVEKWDKRRIEAMLRESGKYMYKKVVNSRPRDDMLRVKPILDKGCWREIEYIILRC